MIDQSDGIAQMAAAVEEMNDGFATLRAVYDDADRITDFEITYVNAAGARELRCTPEGLIGRRLCEAQPEITSSGFLDKWRGIVETGRPVLLTAVPYATTSANGVLDLHAWRFGDGIAVRWRAVSREGEQVRLEGLGRLAGGIAHDFNNLLAVITNYTAFVSGAIEIALRTDDVAPLGEALRDIEQIALASDRATVRTRQLLAFARREVSHPRPMDLNTLVADVSRQCPPPDNVVVTTGLAVNLPGIVADCLQIENVLQNLIVNAYEAMPNGGAVHVSTGYASRDDVAGVELRVRDSGVGMNEAVRMQAFEPFFTTKDLGAGVGLGLATVHGVIAHAGGSIDIETARGFGTTIVVWLPAAD